MTEPGTCRGTNSWKPCKLPTYTFTCQLCGHTYDEYLTFEEHDAWRSLPQPCMAGDDPPCLGLYEQVIGGFSIIRGMDGHYNPSVGTYVSSDAQFRSELSRASDAATERTGIAHNFQPIDPRDKAAAGVDDAGMDETYAAQTETGRREVKKFL